MKKKDLTYKKQAGFKVPKDYFENFKINSPVAETENIFTKKSKMSSGFTTPDNYLKDFSVPLQKEVKVISLSRKKIIYSVAGIAAILICIFNLVPQPQEIQVSSNEIDPLSIENYIEDNDFEFSSREFDLFFDTSLDQNDLSMENELNSLDEETILEYLNRHTEVNTFIND